MADVEMDNDSDPIMASYDVYIKPHISEDRQIYILQFPNRASDQHYSAAYEAKPQKLRVKEQTGMVELDVPVDAWRNYDREKGIKWGQAINKSNNAKGGGSHGLPGGFGIGGAAPGGRGRAKGEEAQMQNQQAMLNDYAGSIQRDQVLTKQTLGGQTVSNAATTPRYFIGAFRKNQLHFTPVDHIVQMRPQFHHIDAESEQARAAASRAMGVPQRAPAEARAVHMTVKSNVDGEEDSTDTMGARITAVQTELWKTHKFIDEDATEAWDSFQENMFVASELRIEDNGELQDKMPKLKTALDNPEYMDTISAPSNPAKLSRSKIRKSKDEKGKGKEKEGEAAEESDTSSTLSGQPSESKSKEETAA